MWRKMLNAREDVEHKILWEMKSGTINVWHENWTGLGALYHLVPPEFHTNEDLQEVAELRQEASWNEFEGSTGYWDKPLWKPTASGKFAVSSAWHIVRHRANPNLEYKHMWIKGLPFKISFFIWRLWMGKLATDDLWRRQGYICVSRCWCCQPTQDESFEHLFLTSTTTTRVWKTFMNVVGINIQLVQVHQVIRA
ncbi:uncharacterized protein LOC142168961 [Nicotiana tabacum]|uniref:Uncharacterized protein LOC142168961 n=1 Tax=Nicotiana tabacum TaxID=4097 RepID=A0AC58SMN4_TOBAC